VVAVTDTVDKQQKIENLQICNFCRCKTEQKQQQQQKTPAT
jgi:hypothetical protein